jgi:hypothetical protein
MQRGCVCGSWGNGSHLGSRGTRPVRRGKRRAVGIGQWRRIDITGCLKIQKTGSSPHQAMFMHRVSVIVHCVVISASTTITGIVFHCIIVSGNKSFSSKKPFAFILIYYKAF